MQRHTKILHCIRLELSGTNGTGSIPVVPQIKTDFETEIEIGFEIGIGIKIEN